MKLDFDTRRFSGYICIKTTAMAEDCVVARMANIVEEAQKNKSRTQRLLDKCAKYYTPGESEWMELKSFLVI